MKADLTIYLTDWRQPRIERYADGWNHAYFGFGYFAWRSR